MQPYHRLVPGILEKMPVLIYAVSLSYFVAVSYSANVSPG